MYIGMFNLASFTTFTMLFFKNNLTYNDNSTNLIILSLGAIFYVCTILLFLLDPDPFDYFRYSFKRSAFAMGYYYFYSITIIGSIGLL